MSSSTSSLVSEYCERHATELEADGAGYKSIITELLCGADCIYLPIRLEFEKLQQRLKVQQRYELPVLL